MSQPVTSSDYCKCFLATAANDSQTTLVVTTPTEPFPTFDVDHTYFYLTIVDAASYAVDAIPPAQREIVKVTAYISSGTGFSLTVDRAVTTTAQTWAAGAVCEIRSCEQFFEDLKGGGTNIQASYATIDDESVDLPNSRQLIAGANVTLTDTGPSGTLTIAANAGSGAPVDATYVTLSTNSTLTQERVLTAGTGISVTDAGANSTVTVANTALGEGYILVGTSALLTADRVLTAGSGITLTDNGANSTLVIAAASAGGLKSQSFTGSGTFDVPADVSGIWITAIGGGGGGYGTANSSTQGGAGGGAGEEATMLPLTVTPSGTVSITIGAGGAGGASGGNDGSDGGTTTVGPYTFLGGKGGTLSAGNSRGGPGGGVGGANVLTPIINALGTLGSAESSTYFGGSSGGGGGGSGAVGKAGGGSGGYLTGGAGGAIASAHAGGGGGAATPYGTGGAGGAGDAAGNNAPTANSGAGGGGAGANTANAGGDGAAGKAIIFWVG